MSFVQGPVAPENNPSIEPQWFQPSAFTISAITLGTTTSITTEAAFDVDCNYVSGQLVRLVIPPTYGARQLNGVQAYVLSVPATNQVTLALNTSLGVDAFIASPDYGPTPPQIMAIGDINSGGAQATGRSNNPTTIRGAFENISPSAGG